MANKAITRVELGLTKTESGRPVRAILKLETHKGYRGGVMSTASVMWAGDQFESCTLCEDFSKMVKVAPGTATQKAIDRQHAAVFTDEVVAGLVAEALANYPDLKVSEVSSAA